MKITDTRRFKTFKLFLNVEGLNFKKYSLHRFDQDQAKESLGHIMCDKEEIVFVPTKMPFNVQELTEIIEAMNELTPKPDDIH